MIESTKLLKELRNRIKKIYQPILVIQSKNDRIINQRGRKQVYNAVNSEDKIFVEVNKGGHVILLDEGCEQAIDIIMKWLLERKSKDNV